jgi:hypothetical protein
VAHVTAVLAGRIRPSMAVRRVPRGRRVAADPAYLAGRGASPSVAMIDGQSRWALPEDHVGAWLNDASPGSPGNPHFSKDFKATIASATASIYAAYQTHRSFTSQSDP